MYRDFDYYYSRCSGCNQANGRAFTPEAWDKFSKAIHELVLEVRDLRRLVDEHEKIIHKESEIRDGR